MDDASGPKTIDEYIAGFPPEIRERLEQVRAVVKAAAPEATEKISYGMPAFDLYGRRLVYFAGWNKHVGFYLGRAGVMDVFEEELKTYKQGKGSVQFPHDRPLPVDLIRKIVELRAKENAEAPSK